MGHCAVLQPNGKMAVWSTIVDHFVIFDGTDNDAIRYIENYHTGDIAGHVDKVRRGVPADENEWRVGWVECVSTLIWRYGTAAAADQLAITPESMLPEIVERVGWAISDMRSDQIAYLQSKGEQGDA